MENPFKQAELHPDLIPYVENDWIFPVLRHPLVYSVPYFKELNNQLNKLLEFKLAATKKNFEEKNYHAFVWLHERPHRLEAFSKIETKLNPRDYWELLADIWIDSENIYQNKEAWRIFLTQDRSNQKYFMSEEERRKLSELPAELTIYRGFQRNQSKDGFSYSLSKEKAQWFAKRFGADGITQKRVIKRKDVFAYLIERGEEEIIYLK